MGPNLPSGARERLIVALDVADAKAAASLVDRLGEDVLWVKIGLELFCSAGPEVVREVAARGKRIFLDLKFHDIPNTVARAVESASRLPVHLVNMHAASGNKAMEAARQAAAGRGDLGVLAVTRLTSDAGGDPSFEDVARLAGAAADAGLFGVVCPAGAAQRLRERYGDRLARVCPGIRPAGTDANDQVSIATPSGAVLAGAHWIVVGRPITQADDPAAAARRIRAELEASSGV